MWTKHLTFALWISSAIAQQCYWPDGKTESPWLPCDPSNSASACCPDDGFCLSNGLCYTNGVLTRGGCVDKNWGPGCPADCRGTNPPGAAVLSWCNFATNLFTCGSCSNQSELFTLRGADRIVLHPYQAAPVQDPSSSSVLTIGPSAQLPTPFNAAKASASATSSGSGGATSTATVTKTVTTAGSTLAAQAKSSSNTYTGGDVAGAAVGVGVPLLIALAAALFVIWRQRKRMRSMTANSAASSSAPLPAGSALAPSKHDMAMGNGGGMPVYSPMSTNSQTTAVSSAYGPPQTYGHMPPSTADMSQSPKPHPHAPVPVNEIGGRERLELPAER